MSAMPERVEQPTVDEIQAGTAYITADPVAHKVCNWMIAFGRRDAESRLLAAEARAKAIEDGPLDYMSGKCDRLKEQNAALRADLDALVPLARVGIIAVESRGAAPIVVRGITDEQLTQARAILARSVDGGDHYGSRRHPDREPDQG